MRLLKILDQIGSVGALLGLVLLVIGVSDMNTAFIVLGTLGISGGAGLCVAIAIISLLLRKSASKSTQLRELT